MVSFRPSWHTGNRGFTVSTARSGWGSLFSDLPGEGCVNVDFLVLFWRLLPLEVPIIFSLKIFVPLHMVSGMT